MAIEHAVISDYKRNRSGRYIRKQSPLDRFISFCYRMADSGSLVRLIAEIVIVFTLICFIGLYTTRTYVTGHGWVSDRQAMELYDRTNGGGER